MVEDILKKHLQDELALAGLTGSVSAEEHGLVWRNSEGRVHREGGPAIEWKNGDKSWYRHGKLHREGGPAIENANGAKCYFLNGKHVTAEEVMKQ